MRALGIKAHVLRYWEEQFPMLRPLTRGGGRRYYRVEDIALLREIDRLLHREGYTIRGARQALKGWKPGGGATTPVSTSGAAEAAPQASDIYAENSVPMLSSGQPEDQIVQALKILRGHLESIRTRLAGALAEA